MRVSIFVNLPALLRELGQDPGKIVAAVELDLGLFDDPENTIPFVTMSRLVALCAEQTRCEHFGLLLGERSKTSDLGLVGYLAQHSPDVGSALRNLILHLHLHDRGAVPTLTVRGEVALLGYAIYQPGVVRADQIYDGAMAIASTSWHPCAVQNGARPKCCCRARIRRIPRPIAASSARRCDSTRIKQLSYFRRAGWNIG